MGNRRYTLPLGNRRYTLPFAGGLRLIVDLRGLALPYSHAVDACVLCGCTDDAACEDGFFWVADNLCSACAYRLSIYIKDERHAVCQALAHERNLNLLVAVLGSTSCTWREEEVLARIRELARPEIAQVLCAQRPWRLSHRRRAPKGKDVRRGQ